VAEDEGDLLARAQVGEPVPAEDALDAHDRAPAVGLDGLEEGSRLRAHPLVYSLLAVRVQDAQIQRASMKVDTAVVLMLARVESHGSPSCVDELFALSSFLPLLGKSRRGPA
jgi:hypothetical protein